MLMILLIILIVLMLGGLPQTGLHGYGYGPSLLVVALLVVLGLYVLRGRL